MKTNSQCTGLKARLRPEEQRGLVKRLGLTAGPRWQVRPGWCPRASRGWEVMGPEA